MQKLSYSTMAELMRCPHAYVNKQMGLERFEHAYYDEGRAVHRVIQEHVSGTRLNPLLEHLPLFDTVETEDFDPKTYFEFEHNGFIVHGYLDGYDSERHELLEIKSSSQPWTLSKFADLVQWRIYALAKVQAKKAWFVSVPRDMQLWNVHTIKIYNSPISFQDKQKAVEFIDLAIDRVKNIKDAIAAETTQKCSFKQCPYKCWERGK